MPELYSSARKRTLHGLIVLIAGLLLAGVAQAAEATPADVVAATGASIPEANFQLVVHVAVNGDDAAAGGADAPLKTLQQALKLAVQTSEQGKAARVVVHAGVYREQLRLAKQVSENAGVVCIEADQPGSAVLSGADAWPDGWERFHVEAEGWKWSGGDERFKDARIFWHAWPFAWEPAENPWGGAEVILDPAIKRTEQVFINCVPLRLALSFGELREGRFHVNTDTKRIYLWPPAGVEPGTALTEIPVRNSILDTGGRDKLVFRGLTFQHSRGTTYASGLSINGSHNVLVERCRFAWNGWNGTGCANAEGVTYRGCVAERNGVGGMGAYQSRNLLIEDCVDSFNNWRGRAGGFIDWANGSKFLSTRTVTFRRHQAAHNETYGLWIDWDNRDILVEQSTLSDNLLAGIFLEASQGPILVRDCSISGNRSGINDGRSDNVSLINNRFSNNRDAQLLFTGNPNGRDITEFDSKQKLVSRSRNWRIEGNAMTTDSATAVMIQSVMHFPESEWTGIAKELKAAKNVYTAPAETLFLIRDKRLTLEEWRKVYGIDLDSTFTKK